MAAQQNQAGLRETAAIAFPGTEAPGTAWNLYNQMIAGIPEGVLVRDYCLGLNWSYVEAECGMGVAMTCSGGSRAIDKAPLVGRPLREVAALSKSWNFAEATLGVAALNAWYSRRELIEPHGAVFDDMGELPEGVERRADAFAMYAEEMPGKRVTVVGHFPHVERIAKARGGILTVLERNCTDDLDTPDPACEYMIPEQDYLFMTGVTFTNKTMTRLLELARMGNKPHTVLVGPSVVPAPVFFDLGVECLAGSVVVDPEGVRALVERGSGQLFGTALLMFDCFSPASACR